LEDLSNIYVARKFSNKIILVADIERGGVFASIYGTYALLPKELQRDVIGVVINRFRGDETLFDEGIEIIENRFNLKVLGILPYFDFNLGFEDSLSLKNYKKNPNGSIKIAIIKTPKLSNFNDFEVLINDPFLDISFIHSYQNLSYFDMVILGGSKTTIDDLLWLKSVGLFDEIKSFRGLIVGICGGYQMLFEKIVDIDSIESSLSEAIGFGFIDDEIFFQREKELKRGTYNIFGIDIEGFEIHNGISKKYPISFQRGDVFGTHIHSLFDSESLREYLFQKLDRDYRAYNYKVFKRELIDSISLEFESRIDIEAITNSLSN
jgi:adenosylcobyric acid synthase